MTDMKLFSTLYVQYPECPIQLEAQWQHYKKKCFCLYVMKQCKLTGLDVDSTPQGQRKRYDKRWGKGSSYASVQFQQPFLACACALHFMLWRWLKSTRIGRKMLWSKTVRAQRYSFLSAQLQWHSYFVHTFIILIFSLMPLGKTLNKFLRAGINPHLAHTKTYSKQVKRSFCWKISVTHTT